VGGRVEYWGGGVPGVVNRGPNFIVRQILFSAMVPWGLVARVSF